LTAPQTSRLAKSFLPTTAVLEMTYRCNHRCVFCSCPWEATDGSYQRHPEMAPDDWRGVLYMLADKGVPNIAFTGGEPLLNPSLVDLIEYAAGLTTEHVETKDGELVVSEGPLKLYLLSNGHAVSADILALCRRHDINLSLSMPGLSTFEWHTGGGNVGRVLGWFRAARDAGVRTTVGVTVTRRNLFELYETLAEGLLAGATNVLLNRFLPGGRGLDYAKELVLSREQIVEMLDTAEGVLREANRWGSVGTELPKCIIDPSRYERLQVGTRCSAALGFFVIGPEGRVRVCNHSQVRLCHWREIDTLKADPYWRRFTMKDYLPRECAGCADMGACDGGCREAAHIVGGQVDSVDPVLAPYPNDTFTGSATAASSVS